MGPRVVILGIVSYGVGFGCSGGTWPAMLGFWIWFVSVPGLGPIHLLLPSASGIGFSWDPVACVWIRPGLPPLDHIASPLQYFKVAIIDAWNTEVCGDLGVRAGFRGGTRLDLEGSLPLLSASHLRESDKKVSSGCSFKEGVEWISSRSCLEKLFRAAFAARVMGMGIFFWDCTHPPFAHIRENPEFHALLDRDKSSWHRCLNWHGWLPALASPGGESPWASEQDIAENKLHFSGEAYSDDILHDWSVDRHFLDTLENSVLADDPDVWTDGSLVSDDLTGIASGGAGFFAHTSGSC